MEESEERRCQNCCLSHTDAVRKSEDSELLYEIPTVYGGTHAMHNSPQYSAITRFDQSTLRTPHEVVSAKRNHFISQLQQMVDNITENLLH